MPKIEIEWLEDSHDCELCGQSYADGARVTLDGATILELNPHAHCYNGSSWDQAEVFEEILGALGYEVEAS